MLTLTSSVSSSFCEDRCPAPIAEDDSSTSETSGMSLPHFIQEVPTVQHLSSASKRGYRSSCGFLSKHSTILALMASIVALIVGISVYVDSRQADSTSLNLLPTESSTEFPSSPSSDTDPQDFQESWVRLSRRFWGDHVFLPESPPWKALQWLITEDPLKLALYQNAAMWKIDQRYALAVFYFAWSGHLWPQQGEWLGRSEISSSPDECDWYGIVCNSLGQVTRLDLARDSFTSVLAVGTLPSEIGFLRQLTSLDVSGQQLVGSIPRELTGLSHMERLVLASNRFTQMPDTIGDMKQLVALDVRSNILEGTLPSSFSDATSLELVILRLNVRLEGNIFNFMSRWPNIFKVDVGQTNMTGTIPTSISRLTNLESLELDHTRVHGTIPTEIGLLEKFQLLGWFGGALEGTIPTEIGLLQNLRLLALNSSPKLLSTIPTEIGQTELQYLDLFETSLHGSIPPSLAMAKRLLSVRLYSTDLTGTVPSEIAQLQELNDLQLHWTQLMGVVPDEVCALDLDQFTTSCRSGLIDCPCCTACT